jgi:tetratricopeptide (TPR) repeat protein
MSLGQLSTDSGSPESSVTAAGIAAHAPPSGVPPQDCWLTVAVCCFLAAIVWAVFGQTRHFEFVNYDDPDYVFANPLTNQGLSWHNVVWAFTHENRHEWFPVTYVTRMLDSQLYGSGPGGPHLTNVLLHAATAILLFLVLRKLTGAFWRAALVAAVFAIHPLRVESVAWVVERKDVLSGLFFMLTLWAWTHYAQNRPAAENPGGRMAEAPRGGLPAYLLALLFFALGLLSKSMLVTLPFLLLLLDYWPLNRVRLGGVAPSGFKTWLRLILEKIPFLLLSAGAALTTVLTQTNVVRTAQNGTLFWRLGNVLLAYTDYLKHMVYPVGLAVVYTHSDANPPVGSVALAGLILFAISAAALAAWRKHPYLIVGWCWYLGVFLPVIDSMQATQNARADRYTYLPQIGLYILLAWGAAELLKPWRYRRMVLGCTAAIILAVLMVDAYIQTGYWKDSVSLWTRTLACTSNNYFAETSLGSELANQKKWNEAVSHYERALEFNPNHAEAHLDLGIALANLGRPADAIQQLELALQLNPNSAAACYNLGGVLSDQGNTAAAIPYVVRALQLKPDYPEAHYDLGRDLASQGKWDEATPQYEQALHQKLDSTDTRYITGVDLAAHKKWDQAIELYGRVLQARPDSAQVHYRLGIALASQGKPSEAVQHFQHALTLATAQADTALADSIRTQLNSVSPAPSPQPVKK